MKQREGSLEAPTRHPVDWQSRDFGNPDKLNDELARVFDICHGCRRCVNLCSSFPTMFDLIDESETMEVDGVDKGDYMNVVDQCYLCDLCYMTKCPYVPPHEWNVDFPHLMLRAKARRFKDKGSSLRDKVLTSTDTIGALATIPLVDIAVNTLNGTPLFRNVLESALDVHHEAPVPRYQSRTMRRRFDKDNSGIAPEAVGNTTGKVALYATCYGNYSNPDLGKDFTSVFRHNGIHIDLAPRESCCGMPKLELGDLESVAHLKDKNIPVLARLADQGYDLTAPIPSCVLMYKKELPLLFPDDADVRKVADAFFDPFEYLYIRHRGGALVTDFKHPLGDVSYQVACHQRVQNIGLRTRDILKLVPDTNVDTIERCSGHDGTYAVKKETRDNSVRIARPVVRQVNGKEPDHFSSDCPMAGTHIAHLSDSVNQAQHPMTLLRIAYGL